MKQIEEQDILDGFRALNLVDKSSKQYLGPEHFARALFHIPLSEQPCTYISDSTSSTPLTHSNDEEGNSNA